MAQLPQQVATSALNKPADDYYSDPPRTSSEDEEEDRQDIKPQPQTLTASEMKRRLKRIKSFNKRKKERLMKVKKKELAKKYSSMDHIYEKFTCIEFVDDKFTLCGQQFNKSILNPKVVAKHIGESESGEDEFSIQFILKRGMNKAIGYPAGTTLTYGFGSMINPKFSRNLDDEMFCIQQMFGAHSLGMIYNKCIQETQKEDGKTGDGERIVFLSLGDDINTKTIKGPDMLIEEYDEMVDECDVDYATDGELVSVQNTYWDGTI